MVQVQQQQQQRALQEAHGLVEIIYHQLTEGDAPTMNEPQQPPPQQQQELASSDSNPMSLASTTASQSVEEADSLSLYPSLSNNNTNSFYNSNNNKLGHALLVTLCSEVMMLAGTAQTAAGTLAEDFEEQQSQQQQQQAAMMMNVKERMCSSPLPLVALLKQQQQQPGQTPLKLPHLRISSSPQTKVLPNGNARTPAGGPPLKELPQRQPVQVQPRPVQPKLQLFGSEYARHLSTSQLAPPTSSLSSSQTKATSSTTTTNQHHAAKNGTGALNQQTNSNNTTVGIMRRKQRLLLGGGQRRHYQNSSNTLHDKHKHCRLEHASNEIQTGALLDIICTRNDEPPPTGYYRIMMQHQPPTTTMPMTGGSSSSNNNHNRIYINVKKEASWDKAAQRPCITAITVVFPGRNEIVPPGFSLVRLHKTNLPAVYYSPPLANNNHSSGGGGGGSLERMYICIRRSREGNPITDVRWLPVPEFIPNSYTVVERSPRNHVASFCGGGGNHHHHATTTLSFIAYRQRLANLEALRPPPLSRTVLAQYHQQQTVEPSSAVAVTEKKSNRRRLRLLSYYATGGATVHSESLGRFHILDRSTHSLISPSAIFNRLNIIESSRRRSNSVGTTATSSSYQLLFPTGNNNGSIYARSDVEGNDDDNIDNEGDERVTRDRQLEPSPLMTSVDELGQIIGDDDDCQLSVQGDDDERNANISSLLVGVYDDDDDLDSNGGGGMANTAADGSLRSEEAIYKQAMDFIPTIKTFLPDASLERRIALITPILTACYARHGGAAWAAVNGLTRLLTETDFFLPDIPESVDAKVGITLLDLTMQTVCDVATSGAQESHFAACVDFAEAAVRYTQGNLSARTVGFIVRFYLFVFYFDASNASPNQSLPLVTWRPTSMKNEEDFPFLFEPDERKTYLSGGSAQSAVLALKELVSLTVVRLGRVSKDAERKAPGQFIVAAADDNYKSYFGGVIAEAISSAVDCVERSRLTQLAIHQIHRSGGSELFWHEMVYACGREMFSSDNRLSAGSVEVYGIFFALLETIIKTASGKIKATTGPYDLLPKDMASKLLSLELLLHMMEAWNDEQDSSTSHNGHLDASVAKSSLGYAIRRTVVPCLLWNTKASLESSQVFRRLIRVLSELWCSQFYRSHCKLELAILIEHFALNLLELGPQCFEVGSIHDNSPQAPTMLITQQNEVILEIRNWFANDPNDAIDLFLNYDTDLTAIGSGHVALTPGKRSRLLQRLCSGLGRIAERCDEIVGEHILFNQSLVMSRQTVETTSKSGKEKLRIEAARLLRKSSLEALSQIVKAVATSAGSVIGGEYAAMFSSWCHDYEPSTLKLNSVQSGSTQSKNMGSNDAIVGFWNSAIVQDKIRTSTAAVPTKKDSIQKSFAIAKEKSVKKAIEFLIACNVLKPSPREIASFLFAHKERFDPADLGVFLSEGGTGGQEVEHWKLVRYLYIRSISFIDLQVDEGLRHFLSTCGFRLPDEAQKIDRLLCSFAQCFFEDNAGDNTCCPFKDEDTVYLLVFAIIMLNTDLHKVDNPKSKRRQQKKMTKADFANNLKNAVQSEGVPKAYLGRVYDSILTKPISLLDCNVEGPSKGPPTQTAALEHIVANVQKADALLRSSAVHEYPFLSITDLVENLQVRGDDAATDVSRSCVSRTWHYWYGAVNSCLSIAHLDPSMLVPVIDVLVYGLSVSVCLDMPMERSAFLWQVVRLRSFDDRRHGNFLDDDTAKLREEKWFTELDSACTGLMESKLTVLRKIYEWGKSLRLRLQLDVKARMELSVAVQELANGDFLLQDPARTFLQSGNLMKISSRTGRTAEYRFYLFSDVLLYASKDPDGRYRIHEDLPLHLMKIVDWFPQKQKNRNLLFAIHHSRKTFQVLCPTVHSRKAWVEDIRAAIMVELERKMANEAARISAATAGKR